MSNERSFRTLWMKEETSGKFGRVLGFFGVIFVIVMGLYVLNQSPKLPFSDTLVQVVQNRQECMSLATASVRGKTITLPNGQEIRALR